jgi:hypothetical protein
MKQKKFLVMAFLVVMVAPLAGCFFYSEQSFKGTILDIDTKQPIEGAVVVAEYRKAYLSMGAGKADYIMDVREMLTDKEGKFYFPSHVALSSLISTQIPTTFIIFKPGYASLGYPQLESQFFTGEEIKEKEGSWPGLGELKYRLGNHGTVEIPRLRTKSEMERRMLGFPTGYGPKELPLLYKAYEEEKRVDSRGSDLNL